MICKLTEKIKCNGVKLKAGTRLSINPFNLRCVDCYQIPYYVELQNGIHIMISVTSLEFVEYETNSEKEYLEDFINNILDTPGLIFPEVLKVRKKDSFAMAYLSRNIGVELYPYKIGELYSYMSTRTPKKQLFFRAMFFKEIYARACEKGLDIYILRIDVSRFPFLKTYKRTKENESLLFEDVRLESAFSRIEELYECE